MDTTQLLKGVLDLAVLAVVADREGYGYDIVRRLRAAGMEEVGDASVYGTLRRLYAAGRAVLDEQAKTWSGFANTMQSLLARVPRDVTDDRDQEARR